MSLIGSLVLSTISVGTASLFAGQGYTLVDAPYFYGACWLAVTSWFYWVEAVT